MGGERTYRGLAAGDRYPPETGRRPLAKPGLESSRGAIFPPLRNKTGHSILLEAPSLWTRLRRGTRDAWAGDAKLEPVCGRELVIVGHIIDVRQKR